MTATVIVTGDWTYRHMRIGLYASKKWCRPCLRLFIIILSMAYPHALGWFITISKKAYQNDGNR